MQYQEQRRLTKLAILTTSVYKFVEELDNFL
jgi:hypothetical protein